jgi:gamma-glutamylcyclotransferase
VLSFGYGSNMCVGRLRFRVPHAEGIAVARLAGYSFRFHKWSSKDKSTKADALRTGNEGDFVWGVVFRIPRREKPSLDHAEGLGYGYREEDVRVIDPRGTVYRACIYLAEPDHIEPARHPYTWYRRHVTEGARHWGIDPEYIAKIEAMPADDDPDPRRARCELLFPAGRELSHDKRAIRDRSQCAQYD